MFTHTIRRFRQARAAAKRPSCGLLSLKRTRTKPQPALGRNTSENPGERRRGAAGGRDNQTSPYGVLSPSDVGRTRPQQSAQTRGDEDPSHQSENESFLPVIKGKSWSLCNTNTMYTHFLCWNVLFLGGRVIVRESQHLGPS